MHLHPKIKEQIDSRKDPLFNSSICKTCSAGCCRQTGFAIFENTIEIYNRYKDGYLVRTDYSFKSGLSYQQFIETYFDVVVYNNGTFYTFYPRVIINNDAILAIPPFGTFYGNRDYFFKNNPWIKNYGCIFQNKKRENPGQDILCILHNQKVDIEISEKPIDCLFLTCYPSRNTKMPSAEETNEWFTNLQEIYKNSKERYENMVNGNV